MKFKSITTMCLALLITLCAGSSAWASSAAKYAPGQIILKVQVNVTLTQNSDYTVTASDSKLQAVLNEIHACWVTKEFVTAGVGSQFQRIYTVYMPDCVDVIGAVVKLSALDCVEYAQPNYVYSTSAVPSDTSYSKEWGLSKINAPAGWDLFTGNNSVVIAVIDTGVDLTHPDLAANLWENPNEIAGNNIDDDNNGFVDDKYGWDFVSFINFSYIKKDGDSVTTIGDGKWKPEDNDPGNSTSDPISGHGTHVAGIVGGVANNAVTGEYNIAGTLWNCQIMPVRAGDKEGHFTALSVAKALHYAADNGAQVINMSLSGNTPSENSIIARAVRYAHDRGVVLCASAGNNDSILPEYPAAFNNVISVAATDEYDKKGVWTEPHYTYDDDGILVEVTVTKKSNYGNTIDISAPGIGILSTYLDDKYAYGNGTSMACPFVSGAAGLILGYGELMGKAFTPGQVEAILENSADNIDANNPDYEGLLGVGRLNIGKALTLAQNSYPMISSILITTADGDDTPTVLEYGSINLIATAVYSDGETEDITNEVTWSVRPVRYGYFCSYEPGKYFALQVDDDREVTATATYTINGDSFSSQCVMTIQNNPDASASPLKIDDGDNIADNPVTIMNPSSSLSFKAIYTIADNEDVDVTANAKWEIISGNQYANFDSSQPGLLTTLSSAAGKTLTIQATYIDENNRLSFQATQTVQVNATSQQIAGLYLTAPDTIAAGATLDLTATLIMTGSSSTQNVTAGSNWSVSPASAGSFIEPGSFLANNVTSTTTATITCNYVTNGTVYTSELAISILPSVASSDTVTNTDSEEDTTSTTGEAQGLLDSLLSCPIAGILTLALMFSGLAVLVREN